MVYHEHGGVYSRILLKRSFTISMILATAILAKLESIFLAFRTRYPLCVSLSMQILSSLCGQWPFHTVYPNIYYIQSAVWIQQIVRKSMLYAWVQV